MASLDLTGNREICGKCVGTALSLGSLCALFPAALASVLFVLRTRWEDETLQAELAGYKDYAHRVRYRLLPGLW
jgi:protein-S-isoprenylcysteine O-methyltransferase Ste14